MHSPSASCVPPSSASPTSQHLGTSPKDLDPLDDPLIQRCTPPPGPSALLTALQPAACRRTLTTGILDSDVGLLEQGSTCSSRPSAPERSSSHSTGTGTGMHGPPPPPRHPHIPAPLCGTAGGCTAVENAVAEGAAAHHHRHLPAVPVYGFHPTLGARSQGGGWGGGQGGGEGDRLSPPVRPHGPLQMCLDKEKVGSRSPTPPRGPSAGSAAAPDTRRRAFLSVLAAYQHVAGPTGGGSNVAGACGGEGVVGEEVWGEQH